LDLINALATQRGKGGYVPAGLLQIDADRQQGVCVLSEEVFSTTPIIKTFSVDGSAVPIILLRKDRIGTDLDMARIFPMKNREPGWMALGFSLSTLIKEIAIVSERTMIATWEGHPLGFTKEGKEFDPQKEGFPLDELRSACLVWEGETYVPLPIDLQEVQLTALIPEDQALAATQFLESLGAEITIKITFSLLGAALISFLIALLLVNRISRKITGPITLLSHAAEDLGKGKYEGLVLPQLKKRHDEVEVLSHSFEKMVVALRDRDKIRGVLNKVVSKEITEEILKSNVELGGEERTLTLLFSDIRGFTHFSETLEPKELIGLLNEYMTRMCRIIDETHGVVDKFVGDEIMALYGAPVALVDHPEKAVEAAVHMIKDLKAWNEERRARQKITFEIGIGIHTGIACTGNMGAENRLNYTAIGANVNLASRLCGAAAPMQILISEETYKQVQEKFRCKALPPISLKGIDHPVSVYEIMAE
jgi:class 3 adenylate cyclase